ncbi:ribonuclease H-like YkuK family protein [Candidatus Berkelbacteria bacterium]|nr:ribonuclease H-like YkuK family protein [Candidatus Berkelbacteria bacterium]
MIARIRDYTAHDAAPVYHRIIVGSDSMPGLQGHVDLITAIVIHRVGRGGIYFWRRTTKEDIHTLRDRMYQEALASIEVARLLVDSALLGIDPINSSALEIHIDIGEHGPTREMIREITGMVTGLGFQVRTKPEAFGANKVADRHT